jgi:hypothetical protein
MEEDWKEGLDLTVVVVAVWAQAVSDSSLVDDLEDLEEQRC